MAIRKLGAEKVRKQFPALVEAARTGEAIIITKHGKPQAAMVSVDTLQTGRKSALLSLRGSGRGLWGKSVKQHIARLRQEWE